MIIVVRETGLTEEECFNLRRLLDNLEVQSRNHFAIKVNLLDPLMNFMNKKMVLNRDVSQWEAKEVAEKLIEEYENKIKSTFHPFGNDKK